MTRYIKLSFVMSTILVSLSSCRVYSSAHPGYLTHGSYCTQAYNQGWCSAQCKRQPFPCGLTVVNTTCSNNLCQSEMSDGSIMWSLR